MDRSLATAAPLLVGHGHNRARKTLESLGAFCVIQRAADWSSPRRIEVFSENGCPFGS